MSKRPTDHLEPSAKKRANDRQLSKHDASSEEEEEEQPGTFQRAPEEVLRARRIVKARRGGESVMAASAVQPTANPFANITLTIPGQSLAPTAPQPPAPGPKAEEAHATEGETLDAAAEAKKIPEDEEGLEIPQSTDSGRAKDSEAAEVRIEDNVPQGAAEDVQPEGTSKLPSTGAPLKEDDGKELGDGGEETPTTSQPPPVSSRFTSFATSTSAPFSFTANAGSGFPAGGGFTFGGFGSSTGNGISNVGGGFGAFKGSEPNKPFSFGSASTSTSSFSFAPPTQTSAFPVLHNVFGGLGSAATPLFGSSLGSAVGSVPKVTLPDEQKQVTGEEEERCMFSSEGVLFQLEDGAWKERGRGEMKCNVGPSGRARLVMRQRGNLRLLLNANLWPDMKVITMDGNKGVTFAVVNAAKGEEGGKEENTEEPLLLTYALRIKNPTKLADFTSVVNEYKAGTKKVDNTTEA
eukprot:jgi/Botrbrau1/14173/Bobra.182_3s0111.1